VGKRYSREEIDQIQALVTEGYTDREIAERLSRTADGIRNIRHRMKLQAETRESLKSLVYEERALSEKMNDLRIEVSSLQARRKDVSKVLSLEEQALNSRLESALRRLKDQKPELFSISVEEQLGKIAGLLGGAFIKWLIEGDR
jgi:predicted nuclease with TOPRIM domain